MVIVTSTYEVFNLIGGPFDGETILRSSTYPTCDAHCEDGDGLVHIYEAVGSALFYEKTYQKIIFRKST